MTLFPLRPLVAAILLALTGLAQAAEDDSSIFSFSGFGTLAAVHSSEREADFVGGVSQPNGAGRTHSTSLNPDSKLGGQLNAKFTPTLSAVLQVVTQHQYDNSWTPQVEWANVQYQILPSLRVRLGRIALPSFLVSETRFVGYANPSVRPPQEVYGLNTITSNDGVDAAYVSNFGTAVNTLSGFVGSSKVKTPGADTKAKSSWGLNDTWELEAMTVRVSYVSMKFRSDTPPLRPLLQGLDGFAAAASAIPVPGIQAAGAQASAIAQRYNFQSFSHRFLAIGATYDPGGWFVTSEYVRLLADHAFSNSNSGYVTAGYRVGTWTPYATLAATRSAGVNEPGISLSGLPAQLAGGAAALNGGVNALLNHEIITQKSATLGLRWDFMKNAAAKLQYDRIDLGANSQGRLIDSTSNFVLGGKVNLVSAAIDFVF